MSPPSMDVCTTVYENIVNALLWILSSKCNKKSLAKSEEEKKRRKVLQKSEKLVASPAILLIENSWNMNI